MKVAYVKAQPHGPKKNYRAATNTRVYFWPKGENVLENLQNRFARPHKGYATMMAEVFEKADIPAGTKFKWKQTAGCRCGCSPGFVLKDFTRFESVHVDVVGDGTKLDPNKTPRVIG